MDTQQQGRNRPPTSPVMVAIDQPPRPVREGSRINAIDAVRGFAMLGILVPNIVAFSWPQAAMHTPAIMGDTPWNNAGNHITSIFFFGKMMFLFACLFGVSVVMFDRKLSREDGTPQPGGWKLWYTRCGWLAAIGALHALLLWYGDILFVYGLAGLGLIWWARRWKPWVLFTVGGGLFFLSAMLLLGFTLLGIWAVNAGHAPPDSLYGNPEAETIAYRGGLIDAAMSRIPFVLFMWLVVFPFFLAPWVTGIMLIGIGLARTGFLTARLSTRAYAMTAGAGIIGGLALTTGIFYGIRALTPEHSGMIWQCIGQFVGIPISLGYAATIILLVRLGLLRPLTAALEAVGRLALSNYLLQTLICTTLFYGYGFGFFGTVEYPMLFLVVTAVWAFNITFSLVWIRFFRFGPAEWAWRSLTYLKPQHMLRDRPQPVLNTA